MKFPSSLVQFIQGEYIASNYKEGVFVFQSLENSTIETVVKSLMAWAFENGYLNQDGVLDTSFLTEE